MDDAFRRRDDRRAYPHMSVVEHDNGEYSVRLEAEDGTALEKRMSRAEAKKFAHFTLQKRNG